VKNRMWRQLGWFSGLMCVGSVSGAVAWGATVQSNSLVYEGNIDSINKHNNYAMLVSIFRAFEVHSFARLEFIVHAVASVLRPARRLLLLKAPPTPATVRITMRSNPSPQRVPHTAVGQLRLTK